MTLSMLAARCSVRLLRAALARPDGLESVPKISGLMLRQSKLPQSIKARCCLAVKSKVLQRSLKRPPLTYSKPLNFSLWVLLRFLVGCVEKFKELIELVAERIGLFAAF